jgi:GTP cyclohydrolase I
VSRQAQLLETEDDAPGDRWRPRITQVAPRVDLAAAESAAQTMLVALGLPFVGVAHVGYCPDDRILGLSKFARLVEFFARRAQTQERLTTQIADHLQQRLAPIGVGVVIEAEHSCMSLRGARAEGARTVTSTLRGNLREDASSRAEFLALTRGRAAR